MNEDVKADCKECGNTEDPISLEEIKENLPNLFMFKQNNYCYCYLIDNIYTYIYGNNRNANAEPINVNNPLTRTPLSNAILEQIKIKYRQIHRLEVPVNRPVQIRDNVQRANVRVMNSRNTMIQLLSLATRNPAEFYEQLEAEPLRNLYHNTARPNIINQLVQARQTSGEPERYSNVILNRSTPRQLLNLYNRRHHPLARRAYQVENANRAIVAYNRHENYVPITREEVNRMSIVELLNMV